MQKRNGAHLSRRLVLSDRRYIPPKEDFPILKFPDVTKELLGKHKVLLKFRNDVEGLDTRAINAIIDFVRKKQAERIENVHFLWNPSDWICIIYGEDENRVSHAEIWVMLKARMASNGNFDGLFRTEESFDSKEHATMEEVTESEFSDGGDDGDDDDEQKGKKSVLAFLCKKDICVVNDNNNVVTFDLEKITKKISDESEKYQWGDICRELNFLQEEIGCRIDKESFKEAVWKITCLRMLTAEQVSGTDDFVAGLADGLEDITESDCNENG